MVKGKNKNNGGSETQAPETASKEESSQQASQSSGSSSGSSTAPAGFDRLVEMFQAMLQLQQNQMDAQKAQLEAQKSQLEAPLFTIGSRSYSLFSADTSVCRDHQRSEFRIAISRRSSSDVDQVIGLWISAETPASGC